VTGRLWFVVESGTDVRLVDGLAERWPLSVLARRIEGGREISQPASTTFQLRIGPASFLRFAAQTAMRLVRERREVGAVVVQGYGVAALFANLAGRVVRVPVVMLVCSPTEAYYRCRRLERGGRAFKRLEWLALRTLARVNAVLGRRYVVLSPYLATVVQAHGASRPVDVVPLYGVDLGVFFQGNESRSQVRRRLTLPLEPVLVFFSSRIAPEKDPDTLLQAVALLRQEGRDIRILHRSGGYTEFVRRADRFGLKDAVIAGPALAPGTTLADHYRAADLCVQASREEGLGFSPLEALACGVPVVAATVGGLRDTIAEGATGWTYRPGDAHGLASAIRDAMARPDEARRRTAQGRDLVARSFERDAVFARFSELLERETRTAEVVRLRKAHQLRPMSTTAIAGTKSDDDGTFGRS
jgi:glycosyltransferase involved in cell wall biosynthesis